MRHRHGGGPVRYRTKRGRVMSRKRPMHPITRKRKREGRRGIRRMAWDIEKAQEEGHIIDWVSPDEYLKKTGVDPDELPEFMDTFYDKDRDEMRPIEELSEYIASEDTNVAIPWIGEGFGGFGAEHEGRHRALAAKLAGEEEIPVAFPIPKNVREEAAEIFIERAFPDSGSSYQEEWRRRFEDGLPGQNMDRKRLKIYREVLEDMELV